MKIIPFNVPLRKVAFGPMGKLYVMAQLYGSAYAVYDISEDHYITQIETPNRPTHFAVSTAGVQFAGNTVTHLHLRNGVIVRGGFIDYDSWTFYRRAYHETHMVKITDKRLIASFPDKVVTADGNFKPANYPFCNGELFAYLTFGYINITNGTKIKLEGWLYWLTSDKLLVVYGNEVKVYDLNGRLLYSIQPPLKYPILWLSVAPDELTVAVCDSEQVVVFDLE